MPNWCANVLVAAGEPEAVAEFRILNAQHTASGDPYFASTAFLSNFCAQSSNDPLSKVAERLVGHRKANGLSFTALTKSSGSLAWGTKWDVVDEAYNKKSDRGAWRLTHHGLLMGRLEEWLLDTAWGPPVTWLESVAKIFPKVHLSLGFEEEDNGLFGVSYACGQICRTQRLAQQGRARPKPIEQAAALAKKSMPLHRRPNALLRAIWSDDEKFVALMLSKKTLQHVEQETLSRWSPLMHAALAGSQNVARLLLDAGSDPLRRTSLGMAHSFGLNDICLDVNVEQAPALVQARQAIFLAALAKDSSLATQRLGTGRDALTLCLRYQMGPLIGAMLAHCPLLTSEPDGSNNGAVAALVNGFSEGCLQSLLGCVRAEDLPKFSCALITSLIDSHTPGLAGGKNDNQNAPAAARLLLHLHDRGLMSAQHFKMLCKHSPVALNADNAPLMISDALAAVVSAERARRAIDEITSPTNTLRIPLK